MARMRELLVLAALSLQGASVQSKHSPQHAAEEEILAVDTHVHNANQRLLEQGFYNFPQSFPDLARPWSMQDLAGDLDGLPLGFQVKGAILMELEKVNNTFAAGMQEALYYQSVARHCEEHSSECGGVRVQGIVVSAPLEAGYKAVAEYIKAVTRTAPLVVGLREGLWKKDEAFFRNPGFLAGLSALAAENLVFDALVEKEQLLWLRDVAVKLPELKVNLNHIGYPDMRNQSCFSQWQQDIRALAEAQNVYCKLSGLPQSYGSPGWNASVFAPYIDTVLQAFGSERVNYAGNWFVLTDEQWQGTYSSMLGAVTQAIGSLGVSFTAQQDIFFRTAEQRLYNASTSVAALSQSTG
uniref:Amidohydrolase-related domain-containing protein n=1 Tax=Rhizochromulina marina TaxID=1034831 RepID=A0A7S2R8L0_9STRA|mmetsp:Transcript_12662/g.36670  ORF Transcript_12662/g.36670 Transcript_12662/m.36670 type:complete len:353 (+) Transcript_12662:13-1071(+)